MTETPRRQGIRGPIVAPQVHEDPDKTVEIPITPPVHQLSAFRQAVDRTSAAIQRHDGRKIFFALLTMVAALAIAIVFPLADLLARFVCAGLVAAFGLAWLRVLRGSEQAGVERAQLAFKKGVAPSRRAKRILVRGEKVWFEEQEHQIVLLPWLFGWILITVALTLNYAGFASLITMGVFSCSMMLVTLWWQRRRFCFTNWRVFSTEGVISRNIRQMAYGKMTDLQYKVPWHSLALVKLRIIDRAYGTLVLESAGQDQALRRIPWLRDIEGVYLRLSQISAPTKEGDGT